MRTIGLLHPGAMGAAVGRTLVECGHTVLWISAGRSEETTERAQAAGLTDAGELSLLLQRCEVVLSICPPHAAREVAAQVKGFGGLFVDANAISPASSAEVAALVVGGGARFVDGGIIGLPPSRPGQTRLYLSGPDASAVAALWAEMPAAVPAETGGAETGRAETGGDETDRGETSRGETGGGDETLSAQAPALEAVVIAGELHAASALKMAYASFSKAQAALLLNARALARALGVEDRLAAEWARSAPELEARLGAAATAAATKGWRWVAEMEEIAATMSDAGLPDGFHLAAADIFARVPKNDDTSVGTVLTDLLGAHPSVGTSSGGGVPT